MASKESSPEFHFTTLLTKRELVRGCSFKSVATHPVDFSTNGLNTSNFLNKVAEISEYQSTKSSGGFIVLRPQQGVSVFTQSHPQSTTPTPCPQSSHQSVWKSIPSLQSFKSHEVLYSSQKAAEWKVPLFGWNKEHKKAVIERNHFRANNPSPIYCNRPDTSKANASSSVNGSEEIFRATDNPFVIAEPMDDDTKCPDSTQSSNGSNASNGRKRKNHPNPSLLDDQIQHPKRQKIESQHPTTLLSYHSASTMMTQCESTNTFDTNTTISTNTTTSSNVSMANNATPPMIPTESDLGPFHPFRISSGLNSGDRLYDHRDLEFYRGFCCMATTKPDYKRQPLSDYITAIENEGLNPNSECPLSGRENVEDKYLNFIKFFYNGHSVDYGHIEGSERVTCYHNDSPFKAGDLQQYGPFSCLNEEERTKGVHSPYIYIGKSHTFFPWHNEDMLFHAMNHLLYGATKIWFCIAPSDYHKVMKFFRKQFKYYYTDCLTPLQHKSCLMDPYIFSCLGITVYSIIQRPGDIVIVPPGGLHCGFNTGFNVAESVNFMTFDDNQWRLSLSAMLVQVYNFHDCCARGNDLTSTPCLCCKDHCTDPEKRFSCKCKACDPFKCPCDYHIFLDINQLAQRVRDKYPALAPSINIVPKIDCNDKMYQSQSEETLDLKPFKMYHPRAMTENELDDRWPNPPQCHKEWVYPTKDRKNGKFYPAICYDNRIIDNCALTLTYHYKMDFIAYGNYFQFCDEKQVVTPGGTSNCLWTNPPVERQHGFYDDKTRVKGTPSFDWLKVKLNEKSPLVGTEWEHKKIIFAYPPGARKFNLGVRTRKVAQRKKEEMEWMIQQVSCKMAKRRNTPDSKTVYQVEEYIDTASSSSSEHENITEEESSSSEGDNDGDDCWTPEGGKWMKELPEYQYDGLREKKSRTRSRSKVKPQTKSRSNPKTKANSNSSTLKVSRLRKTKSVKVTASKTKQKKKRERKRKRVESDEDYDVSTELTEGVTVTRSIRKKRAKISKISKNSKTVETAKTSKTSKMSKSNVSNTSKSGRKLVKSTPSRSVHSVNSIQSLRALPTDLRMVNNASNERVKDDYDSEEERPLQSLQSSLHSMRSMQSNSMQTLQSEARRRRDLDLIPKKTDLGVFGTTSRMTFSDGMSVEGRPYTTSTTMRTGNVGTRSGRNGTAVTGITGVNGRSGSGNRNRNGNGGVLQRSDLRVKFPDLQSLSNLSNNNSMALSSRVSGLAAMPRPPSVTASGLNGRPRSSGDRREIDMFRAQVARNRYGAHSNSTNRR